MPTLPTLADIRSAQNRIKGAITETPCIQSHTLSAITGCELLFKFENMQFTASFKERGALNRLLTMPQDERARGVVAKMPTSVPSAFSSPAAKRKRARGRRGQRGA